MKKFFQIPAFAIALLLLGAWSFYEKNTSILMVVDSNEKISLLEHGKVDKEVFTQGIKALSVMDKQEQYTISRYMLTFAPIKGDASFVAVYQEKNQVGGNVLRIFRHLVSKIETDDKIIIDNIEAINKQGEKLKLAPIVLYIK